jgi:hypothetical protein
MNKIGRLGDYFNTERFQTSLSKPKIQLGAMKMKSKVLSLAIAIALVIAVALTGASGVKAMPNGAVLAAVEDDVVINEFVVNPTTGKEYVELLVTAPGGVDMQGWTLSDVNTRAATTGGAEGDITLPGSAAYLSSVPQGTYVVIVATTPVANANTLAEDVSLVDGNNRLVLIVGTTSGLTVDGVFDVETSDNLQLYAGTRATGTLIDQTLAGTNTSLIAGATWGDNNIFTSNDNINGGNPLPAGSGIRFVPTADTLVEFQNNDTGTRLTVEAASYGTPGAINTGVSADSAVTNPSYSSTNIPAGSYTGLTISGNVNLLGATTAYASLTLNADLTANGNVLTLASSASVTGSGDVVGTVRRSAPATSTPLTFNNAQTLINFASAPDQMEVTLTKSTPVTFTYALPREYTLTPGTGTVNATVQLAYKPAEIPDGTSESNIVLWRDSGGTWVNMGGTRDTSNPTWHWVSVAGVTEFSPWTLSGLTPTAITLNSFSGSTPTNNSWIVVLLLAATALLASGWALRRRTQS